MDKNDLYIGKEIICCSYGVNCGKHYKVVSDIYKDKDGYEVFDIKENNDECIDQIYEDYLNDFIEG